MATTLSVVTTDDFDGSEGAQTASFSLDGVTYEIDLSEKNQAKLDKAFAPFIEHGRRVTQRRRRSATVQSSSSRIDRANVRAWARENGLKVSERGRISADVIQQYEAAH